MQTTDVKALFYIEPKEEHNRVQHIGCRLLIAEKLIHAGFKKGGAFNLPDGRVEVVLEGNKKDIELFYSSLKEHLVEWLEARTGDKEKLRRMIGNPGITLSSLEFKESLLVLDIGLYSHSLEMSQLEKGVDVYYALTDAIKEQVHASKDQTIASREQIEASKKLSEVLDRIEKKFDSKK